MFFENSLQIIRGIRKIGKRFYNFYCHHIVFLVIIGVLLSITGCSSTTKAPVDNRSSTLKSSHPAFKRSHRPLYYKVKKGDTLYSIAWQYGLDYKQLASWNNVKPPYIIFIGKKLRLASKYKQKKKSSHKKAKGKKVKKKPVKLSSKVNKKKSSKKSKKNSKKAVTKASKNSNKNSPKKVKQKNYSGLKWVWPISGKVIQKFAPSKGKKGIDIAAKMGVKVAASERGKVVYSGHGLTGYGLLIIIKHNDEFLSAYAHNSKLVVKEGEAVKKGQVIAYTGKTATDRVKLHFEIRKNGQPVNPVKYLP